MIKLVLPLSLLLIGTAELPPAPTVPTIDITTTATPRYQPILFSSHDAHAAREGKCSGCHHTSVSDVKAPPECASCHARSATFSPQNTIDLKAAFHKQIRTCHQAIHLENRTSYPPIKCLECHTERE